MGGEEKRGKRVVREVVRGEREGGGSKRGWGGEVKMRGGRGREGGRKGFRGNGEESCEEGSCCRLTFRLNSFIPGEGRPKGRYGFAAPAVSSESRKLK